jgi:carboxymethylenebutenolidase
MINEANVTNEQHIILDNKCEAYLFMPEQTNKITSCIVVFHERYGLVQHTLDVCKRLAANGYVALAPDLFSLWDGDKDALKRGETRAIISDPDCITQLDSWINYMKTQLVGGEALKFVLMGVCQSGRYPVVVASKRSDLAACVIFYGASHDRDWVANELQPEPMSEMIQKVTVPMFFVFAERDHTISLDNVSRLRSSLETANISYRMRVMVDMPHGFLNDTMPGRFRPKQAEQAWEYLFTFLHDVLDDGWPYSKIEWDLQSVKNKNYDFSKNFRLE